MNRIRTFLASNLLRGELLLRWVAWKTEKLVRLYHRLLIETSRSTKQPDVTRTIASKEKLRKLLFITDNVWEKRELVPELSRICETTLTDIHAHIFHQEIEPLESLPAEKVISQLSPFRTERYDCVLVYLRESLLSEELLQFLRRSWTCPLVGMNLDCKTTFADYGVFRREPDGYRHWAGAFDCNLTNAKAMVDVYSAEGLNCLYLPTGYHFDPAIHKVRPDTNFEIGISFVGSCKPDRRKLIDRLKRIGIDVQLFGGGWNGQPFMKEGWRIYQRSQLNLGIGYNVPDARFTNLKNRDFECPGAGGCYLTTYDWELAQLFEVGKEILCYRSLDDLVELYAYYIRRPQACLRIAEAGFDRAKREHTWEQRFRNAFTALGFELSSEAQMR